MRKTESEPHTCEEADERKQTEKQLLLDRKLYGFSVMDADGRRVDPLSVKMPPMN